MVGDADDEEPDEAHQLEVSVRLDDRRPAGAQADVTATAKGREYAEREAAEDGYRDGGDDGDEIQLRGLLRPLVHERDRRRAIAARREFVKLAQQRGWIDLVHASEEGDRLDRAVRAAAASDPVFLEDRVDSRVALNRLPDCGVRADRRHRPHLSVPSSVRSRRSRLR